MKSYEQSVVIVTGGAQGIGEAIVREFAQYGACVVIADRDIKKATHLADELNRSGQKIMPFKTDISDFDVVTAMVDETIKKYKKIDILINNAGIGSMSLFENTTPAMWHKMISVNLNGVFYCCKAVLPYMKESGNGKIVNIASMAATRISATGSAEYTAAKHGVIGLTKHLAFELGPYGINVNAVCPGTTLTPLIEQARGKDAATIMANAIPLGRIVYPSDIANAVLFLASEKADMITGTNLEVDGGQWLGVTTDYISDIDSRKRNSKTSF